MDCPTLYSLMGSRVCSSLPSSNIRVYNNPVVSITGASTICEDVTTTLSPTTGGHWVSSNSAIATVNDSGIATGISGEMQDLLLRKLLRVVRLLLLAGSLWLISRHYPERA